MFQSESQVEQRRPARQPQFPVLGVGDRQLPLRIGVQFDQVRQDPEAPRLAVVQRRSHRGQPDDLLSLAGCQPEGRWERSHARLLIRTFDAVTVIVQRSLGEGPGAPDLNLRRE
ncbi:hypothetical protein [Saccharopolyspora sp. ASAGF58]|uniref:hypothetical protein n=1 Tax=Saccharopolyspora sp. ASAGF58 TaxID=2719023 RepID=UPI001FF0C235|nr:hypothetical protein [Saccharopolyspora sp. ASAGF58]